MPLLHPRLALLLQPLPRHHALPPLALQRLVLLAQRLHARTALRSRAAPVKHAEQKQPRDGPHAVIGVQPGEEDALAHFLLAPPQSPCRIEPAVPLGARDGAAVGLGRVRLLLARGGGVDERKRAELRRVLALAGGGPRCRPVVAAAAARGGVALGLLRDAHGPAREVQAGGVELVAHGLHLWVSHEAAHGRGQVAVLGDGGGGAACPGGDLGEFLQEAPAGLAEGFADVGRG